MHVESTNTKVTLPGIKEHASSLVEIEGVGLPSQCMFQGPKQKLVSTVMSQPYYNCTDVIS